MSFSLDGGQCYNPHTLRPVDRVVDKIVLFDEKGPVYTLKWFCDEEACTKGSDRDLLFDIELKRKTKEDWSVDFAYWMHKKKDYWQKRDDQSYAFLYIPLSKIQITEVADKVLNYATHRIGVTTYKVDGLAVYFEHRKDMRPSKKNKARKQIQELIDTSSFALNSYEVCNNFGELKALVAKIEELDNSVRGGVLS